MTPFRIGQISITGNYRDNNEDSCYVDDQQRFAIVADGMGGQSAGERASALAIELIPRFLEKLLDFEKAEPKSVNEAFQKSIVHTNSEIIVISESEPGLRNMGTTVVMMARVGDRFFFIGVGDSRAYEFRGGRLKQLTTDHSLTQALMDAGTITAEDAKTHRYRNVLYKYLGSRDGASGGATIEVTPKPGDRFLLCSDGLTDGLKDNDIAALMMSSDDPQELAEILVNAALAGGSRDNITALVVIC
ncbi:MAG TPA: protein phosphatase 2C domain-containing protein [Planctomycetaceae bacterium]|nr:protein phosphatase 2C domain-containing protein [Planctomycetaceae bacterium]